jgi:mannose-6-phosphate isomerase-like protein (cupin superfamily)
MKRRKLLDALAMTMMGDAMVALALAEPHKDAIYVPAGEDRFHESVTAAACKLSGKDTGGALAVFGGKHARGSVPMHVHHNQDELWYIFEGETLFQIGDRKIHAKVGDSVFGHRGIPHSFMELSDSGHGITVFQPAGSMENFFHQLAQIWPKTGEMPSPAVMQSLFKAHDMEIVGPVVQA